MRFSGGEVIARLRLVRRFKGEAFFDRGSLHNGLPANLGAALSPEVGWRPALHGAVDPAADVPARVRAGAGAGKARDLAD